MNTHITLPGLRVKKNLHYNYRTNNITMSVAPKITISYIFRYIPPHSNQF